MATLIIDGKRSKVRHMRQRGSGWYFIPSKAMKAAGYHSESLGADPLKAAARAEELNKQWDEERKAPKQTKAAHGSLVWLYEEYKASSWFADLSVEYKADVERCARTILSSPLGKKDAGDIRRSDCRRLYEKILKARGLEPANKHVKMLRRWLNYGIELEVITTNPAAGMQLKQSKPRKVVWVEEWVNLFIDKAIEMGKPGWAIAIAVGYDTSQRPAQVRTALHSQFDGEGIAFPATKGGKDVWCPLEPRTIDLINRFPKKAVTLVYGDKGMPITQRAYFARVYRDIRDAAGIPDNILPKDLRKTAASEVIAGGGRSEPLTGHQPNSPVLKYYEHPNKQAARESQKARKRGKENS
ncbi:hypothetical protein [Nisaea sp.]|uniref:tyrosine-type recombinase/integrase n=1 Tax=Nisaea sp. TaxID=2024842 RepID=UPI003298C822